MYWLIGATNSVCVVCVCVCFFVETSIGFSVLFEICFQTGVRFMRKKCFLIKKQVI